MPYICMKDADYSCIPVRIPVLIVLVFTRNEHDVGMGVYIDGILVAPHVICRIVDTQDSMLIDRSPAYHYVISFSRRKLLFIAIVLEPQKPCQEMILQLWEKVLRAKSSVRYVKI